MWKASAAWLRPVIQATSLMLILGNAIGPQVARPFVGRHRIQSNESASTTTSTLTADDVEHHPVKYAYLIAGSLDFAMGFVCLMTWICTSLKSGRCRQGLCACFRTSPEDDDIQVIPDNSEVTSPSSSGRLSSTDDRLEPCSRQGCVLLALMYVFFVMTAGINVMFSGLLYTYLYEYLGWTVNRAALLVTVYQLTGFTSGAVAVPVSRCVSPSRLNVFNLVALFAASVLILAAFGNGEVLTTVGVVTLGVAESNTHPTTITMIEETIYVIAPIMAMIVSAIGASLMLIGPLAGILLYTSAKSFPLLLLALTLVAMLMFAVYRVLVWVWFSNRRHCQPTQ